jgi:hypothetical protein
MNNQNDQPNDVPAAAQRLNLAVAQVESAARFLSHPNFVLQMREAMIEAAVVAGSEWLCADDACLVAGRISRQTLNKAATDGHINRQFIGDKPMFERASINAAIAEGKLK